MMGRRQIFVAFGVIVTLMTLVSSGFDPLTALFLLAIIYLVLRFATRPLSRFIARLDYSIRWKFEIAITAIAVLFLVVSLIQINAMRFMHTELHDIQNLMASREPGQVRAAIDTLEDTHHGFFYSTLPFLGMFGVLGSAAIGTALALSVVGPLNGMSGAMRRFASGDFSRPVAVENRDELGELAHSINQAGQDLVRLQEATLAQERAQALQERIARVTLAQEEERRRISRELHDGLGPSLAAVGNRIRACQTMVRNDPDAAQRELEEVASNLKGNVQEVRELIHGLRPLALDQLGLAGALGQQVDQFGHQTGIRASLDAPDYIPLDTLTEITVFRIIQECLVNVQKHAGATQVDVSLHLNETSLEARVRDNGRGFDPSDVAAGSEGTGMGLLSMQERAELLGGSVSVHSSPGTGSEVVLYVPLKKEARVGAN